jgi:putative spermidine/putrescine transport system substrate-binding protein
MNRPLRVLSWAGAWGEALRDGVSRPFQDKHHVAVEPVTHVGLRLPNALQQALESGAEPPVDVVWCNTSPALRAAARGWCEPLNGTPVQPVLGELIQRVHQPQLDGTPIVQTYVVHYVLVYRRALYRMPPDSWRVLLRAEHTERIVLYPGGNGFYPVAQVLGGGALADIPNNMDPCWATVRRIGPQLGAPAYSIGIHEAIRRGEIDLCYRALPNVLAFQRDGLDVDWVAPREGIADTTDAMWIPRGLPPAAAAAARAFIAFALSAPVQDRWCAMLGALPARPNMPSDPDDISRVLYVPEDIKASYEPAWEATFEALRDQPVRRVRAASNH